MNPAVGWARWDEVSVVLPGEVLHLQRSRSVLDFPRSSQSMPRDGMCHPSQPARCSQVSNICSFPRGSQRGMGTQPLRQLEPLFPESCTCLPPSAPGLFCWAGVLLPLYIISLSTVQTVTSLPPCLRPGALESSHVHKPRTWRPTPSGWTRLQVPPGLKQALLPPLCALIDFLPWCPRHRPQGHSLWLN